MLLKKSVWTSLAPLICDSFSRGLSGDGTMMGRRTVDQGRLFYAFSLVASTCS